MPILFGTLAAVALAFIAWFGFKNKTMYEDQIELRVDQEDLWDDNVALRKLKKGELADNKQAIAVLETQIKEVEAKIVKMDEVIAGLEKEIKNKVDEMARLEASVKEAKDQTAKYGEIEELIPKINRLRGDIVQLTDDITAETANLSNLKQVKTDTQAKIDMNSEISEKQTVGKSQAFLKTTIKTVYSTWGFVTLNGGDIQGVVPGSTLDVVRDGEVVAKLKVTTVEPNRAAADILRDSVTEEIHLRSGDVVKAEAEVAPKVADVPAGPANASNR